MKDMHILLPNNGGGVCFFESYVPESGFLKRISGQKTDDSRETTM